MGTVPNAVLRNIELANRSRCVSCSRLGCRTSNAGSEGHVVFTFVRLRMVLRAELSAPGEQHVSEKEDAVHRTSIISLRRTSI